MVSIRVSFTTTLCYLASTTWLYGYLWVGRLVSYNHVRQKYVFGAKRSGTRLMTLKELEQCFPGSRIIKQRVTFMAETLIVVGGDVSMELL